MEGKSQENTAPLLLSFQIRECVSQHKNLLQELFKLSILGSHNSFIVGTKLCVWRHDYDLAQWSIIWNTEILVLVWPYTVWTFLLFVPHLYGLLTWRRCWFTHSLSCACCNVVSYFAKVFLRVLCGCSVWAGIGPDPTALIMSLLKMGLLPGLPLSKHHLSYSCKVTRET